MLSKFLPYFVLIVDNMKHFQISKEKPVDFSYIYIPTRVQLECQLLTSEGPEFYYDPLNHLGSVWYHLEVRLFHKPLTERGLFFWKHEVALE